jgi:adhesin transport system outer membrane protein
LTNYKYIIDYLILKYYFLVSVILLSCPSFLWAELVVKADLQGSLNTSYEPLLINQALSKALETHPLIHSRRGDYEASMSDLDAARWSLFPTISTAAQTALDGLDQTSAGVIQPIWSGGRLSGQVESALARSKMALADIDDARQIVLTDTANSFLELNRALIKEDIAQSNVVEHQRLFEIIQRRALAATSPDVDVQLADARLSYAKSQELQVTSSSEIARSQLEQLIGIEVNGIIPPSEPDMTIDLLSELESSAIAYSPRLRQLRSKSQNLKAEVKVASSVLYPQVSLGYERQFGQLLFAQEREQIFLSVEFQPGAGISARALTSAANSRLIANQNEIEAAERELRRQVQIAWQEREAAKNQLLPSRRLVSATKEVVESYLRQYTVGRKSWLDVLNAQREFVQAEFTLSDYRALLLNSSYRLQILSGSLPLQEMLN